MTAVGTLEPLKTAPFGSIDTSMTCLNPEGGTLNESGQAVGIYTCACTYTTGSINGVSTKNITVTVTWSNGGSVALTTIVSDIPQLTTGTPGAYVRSWDQLN